MCKRWSLLLLSVQHITQRYSTAACPLPNTLMERTEVSANVCTPIAMVPQLLLDKLEARELIRIKGLRHAIYILDDAAMWTAEEDGSQCVDRATDLTMVAPPAKGKKAAKKARGEQRLDKAQTTNLQAYEHSTLHS